MVRVALVASVLTLTRIAGTEARRSLLNFVRMSLPAREHEGNLSPLLQITKVSQP